MSALQNNPDLTSSIDAIRAELLDEYQKSHTDPWIIGYSGGKDSTLVTHLVFEMLMSLPRSRRVRNVHVVANDTLVESPLVVKHMRESLQAIQEAATAFDLPITTKITFPELQQTFWVNIIGRGYPVPNRSFRWCTDRMKIQPTSRYIKHYVNESGKVILLLGVRRTESIARRTMVERYDSGNRLHEHSDLVGCMVFRPIVDLSTDDVWEFLAMTSPPWGGTSGGGHGPLIKLYRDAAGGECPVVTQKSDAPSCGTNSSRFGCWTCTVVKKDRSLEGLVESGFEEFGPLLDFRDWLASIRNDPNRRQARRRNGHFFTDQTGTLIPGPFTLQARSEILEKLRELESATNQKLISDEEVDTIYQIWLEDIDSQQNSRPTNIRKNNRRNSKSNAS